MFEWKVEEMELRRQPKTIVVVPKKGQFKLYNCESKVSREDKIAFVDSFQDGKLSYLLDLADKFNEDKKDLPKANNYGNVKSVSLIAWLRRNDTKYGHAIIDRTYHYGHIRFMKTSRYIDNINRAGSYDYYNDFVDECFHRQLEECEKLENQYFLEHDTYSILKRKFIDSKYPTTFGVNIATMSTGEILIVSDDEERKERPITIKELEELLEKYAQLDALVEEITKQTHIVY